MSIYCFDLDGTICSITENQEYEKAIPNQQMVDAINKLASENNLIKIYTARGMGSGKDFKTLTTHQLSKWGVRYHSLIMGKPSADFYIDDKGLTPYEFCRLIR